MEIVKNLEPCDSYYSSPEKYPMNDGDGVGNSNSNKSNNNIGGLSASSSPTSSNSNGVMTTKYISSEEGNSVITFKGGQFGNFMHASGPSLLSFDQNHDGFTHNSYPTFWDNTVDYDNNNYHNYPLTPKCGAAAGSGHPVESSGGGNAPFGWLNPNTAATASATAVPDHERQELSSSSKRSVLSMEEGNSLASKKQCTMATKKAKTSTTTPSKDPQSIAAKNRRERISERLKILQELVPNGSKVDLVTMLEKAISYVKFLQLQVKVLATDEFWPVQGGKAPDLCQVKEAIDAILASQKDRNSSSK